jgi:hypothetical protein
MPKINIEVTATRTTRDDEFQGTIVFKNGVSEIKVEYLFAKLESFLNDAQMNATFTHDGRKFCLEGKITEEMFTNIPQKQRLLILLPIDLMVGAIEQAMHLSNGTTQMLRAFTGDIEGKGSGPIEISEEALKTIFEEKTKAA